MSQFTLQCKLELVLDTSRKTVVSSTAEKVRPLLMPGPNIVIVGNISTIFG